MESVSQPDTGDMIFYLVPIQHTVKWDETFYQHLRLKSGSFIRRTDSLHVLPKKVYPNLLKCLQVTSNLG